MLPVDVENRAQGSGGFVDAVSRNQHDPSSASGSRSKIPVLGQQDPILLGAAGGERAVGKPVCGDDGVVPGRPQPSAEAAQHLIAQKPRHLSDPG